MIKCIYRNTLMDKAIHAFFKIFIIFVPLCTGLFTYEYLGLDFCKSLFLYALALLFDACLQLAKEESSNEKGVLLYIVLCLMVVSSGLLSAISIIGIFAPELLAKATFLFAEQRYVYAAILLETLWYFVETLELFICEILKKIIRRSSLRVSHSTDRKYNI